MAELWNSYNIVSLVILSLQRFSYGAVETVVGPCIPDLAHTFNMTIEDYTSWLSVKGYASVLGLPVTVFVLDHAYHYIEWAVSVPQLGLALSLCLIPWFGSPLILSLIYGLQGIVAVCFNLFVAVHVTRTFGVISPTVFSGIGVVYATGKILAPLLAEPFITESNHLVKMKNVVTPLLNETENKLHVIDWKGQVYIPYVTFGGLCAIVALGFIFLYYVKPTTLTVSQKQFPLSETHLPCWAKYALVLIFASTMLLYMCYCTGNLYYLYVIAVKSRLHFSKSEAAYLVSVFEVTNLCIKVAVVAGLHFVTVTSMFHLCAVLTLMFSVCLALFGLHSHITLWLFAPLANAFMEPMYNLVFGCLDRFMFVRGWISAVMGIGIATGLWSASWLMSYIHKHYKAQGLLVAFCVLTVILNIFSLLVFLIHYKYGNRYNTLASLYEQELN